MRASLRLGSRRILVATIGGIAAVGTLTGSILAVLVATAEPAAAHTVGGVRASNYRTEIRSVSPASPDLTIRAVDLGDRLELTNRRSRDVIVEGYDGEPYLRIGRRGAFENVNSTATYLNRARRAPAPPPDRADPTAAPEWRRIGSGPTVRWHDHRAHWMGLSNPPIVSRAPGEEHLIQRFTIVLHRGDDSIRVRGDVRWVPPPSPWPWIAVAAVVAVGAVLGARTRGAAATLGGILTVAMGAAVVHASGSWAVATGSTASHAGDALPTVGAVVLGVVALAQLRRRGLRAAAPVLVFAGLFLGIAIGLADLSALSNSQLPTDLVPALDRLTIALALGGGFGVAVGAGLHVGDRRPPTSPKAGRPARQSPGTPPAPGSPTPEPPSENDSHSMMQG